MGVRCFTAVDIGDPGVLRRLVGVQRSLEGTGGDLKVVERENIHVTMKFLGDVREGRLGEVERVMEGVSFEAFDMTLRGVGVFPHLRRPRVVWAGVTQGAEELKAIFDQLEEGYTSLDFKQERRSFKPHVTIARVRSGRNRGSLVEEIRRLGDEEFGGFEVRKVALKKSVLTPKGPIYSTLAEATAG